MFNCWRIKKSHCTCVFKSFLTRRLLTGLHVKFSTFRLSYLSMTLFLEAAALRKLYWPRERTNVHHGTPVQDVLRLWLNDTHSPRPRWKPVSPYIAMETCESGSTLLRPEGPTEAHMCRPSSSIGILPAKCKVSGQHIKYHQVYQNRITKGRVVDTANITLCEPLWIGSRNLQKDSLTTALWIRTFSWPSSIP